MDCFNAAKGDSDRIAVGFVSGEIKMVSRFGKVEKSIPDAHKGSVTALKWSKDGQTLVSTSEDGGVKIWSKNGMLRTELMNLDVGVYSVDWSPSDDYVIFGLSKMIQIKPLQVSYSFLEYSSIHNNGPY